MKPVTFKVETLYRVWIEWDHREKVCEITARIEKLKCPKSVHSTDSGGGPCWDAYRIIQGPNRKAVEKYAAKVMRLLRRYKGIRIERA